jgi:hypothetical protein
VGYDSRAALACRLSQAVPRTGGVQVPNRRVAALIVVLTWVLTLVAPGASAQYTEGLPPGVVSVEIDGQPIDSVTIPSTDSSTPEVSGRVDLGVASVDLAVANGEIIRFPAEVDDRGRFRLVVPQPLGDGQYTLYINDLLIGAFVVDGAAAPDEREPGQLLDIARVVPYPADFQDQIPGLGFLDGRFYTIEEEAIRTAAAGGGQEGADARETQRLLVEAGWLQRYENRLAAPNAENPQTFDLQVSSFVVEYASGADARTAYVALAGDEPGIDATTIGNESTLTLLAGVTPDTGVSYQAARLVYRVGPMLGVIIIADLRNQQPDIALLDVVAQSVAARGTVIADRQTIPLGNMTLRLDPADADGALVRRDIYDVRGSQLTALYDESDETRASRVELFSGTTDVFSSTVSGTFIDGGQERDEEGVPTADPDPTAPAAPTSVIQIEGEPSAASAEPTVAANEEAPEPAPAPETERASAQILMVSSLFEFPGEGEAGAWFAAQRDRLAAEPAEALGTYTILEDGPAFGDESATFAAERPSESDDETASGFRIYTRVGQIVTVLEVASVPGFPMRAAAILMEQQVACVEEQRCSGPARLPGGVFVGQTERSEEESAQVHDDAPEAEPTAESVIIIEGEPGNSGDAEEPRAPREPRPDRERRRDRETTEEEASE